MAKLSKSMVSGVAVKPPGSVFGRRASNEVRIGPKCCQLATFLHDIARKRFTA